MAKVEIPTEHQPILAMIMAYTKKKRETLLRALKQTKPQLLREDFANEFALKMKMTQNDALITRKFVCYK
jgi:hypothetical protein